MRRLVRYKPEESFADYRVFFVGATVGKDATRPAGNEMGESEKENAREETVDPNGGKEHSVKLSPYPSPRQ